MYGENFEPQDITKWDKNIECDMIFHGSPCTDFSIAGKQEGGDIGSGTRSSLMYETIRIVGKLRPQYVIWENVKNVISKKHKHNFDNYLKEMKLLGYKNYWEVLNSKDYGIPQNRERVFVVSILNGENFTFSPKQELKLKLKDLLETKVEEKYYLSEKLYNCFNSDGTGNYPRGERFRQNIGKGTREIANTIITTEGNKPSCNFVINKYNNFNYKNGYIPEMFNPYHEKEIKDIAPTQTTQCGSTTSSSTLLKKENFRIRKLTPKECFRLMGFDDIDFEKASEINSNSQLYKQARKFYCCKCIRRNI